MRAYAVDIERATLDNDAYRKVLFTTDTLQLAIMTLMPGELIPEEEHTGGSQFIRVEQGRASISVNGQVFDLEDGGSIIIPPGARHQVRQIGESPLRIYTLYSPPEHAADRRDERQPIETEE